MTNFFNFSTTCHYLQQLPPRHFRDKPYNTGRETVSIRTLQRRTRPVPIHHTNTPYCIEPIHIHLAPRIRLATAFVDAEDLRLAIAVIDAGCMVWASCGCRVSFSERKVIKKMEEDDTYWYRSSGRMSTAPHHTQIRLQTTKHVNPMP